MSLFACMVLVEASGLLEQRFTRVESFFCFNYFCSSCMSCRHTAARSLDDEQQDTTRDIPLSGSTRSVGTTLPSDLLLASLLHTIICKPHMVMVLHTDIVQCTDRQLSSVPLLHACLFPHPKLSAPPHKKLDKRHGEQSRHGATVVNS